MSETPPILNNGEPRETPSTARTASPALPVNPLPDAAHSAPKADSGNNGQPVIPIVGPRFLLVAFLLVSAFTAVLVFAPAFLPASPFITSNLFTQLLLILVCSNIAIFIFGFIGGSTAQFNLPGPTRPLLSLGGAIAGAVGFWYLVSNELVPVVPVTVDFRDSSHAAIRDSAGIEVQVQTDVRTVQDTTLNYATFYLPRGSSPFVEIVSPRWRIDKAEAAEQCLLTQPPGRIRLAASCDWLGLTLVPSAEAAFTHIKDYIPSLTDTVPRSTNLAKELNDRLLPSMRRWASSRNAHEVIELRYETMLDRGILALPFDFRYDAASQPNLCTVLNDLERIFNERYQDRRVIIASTKAAIIVRPWTHQRGDDDCYG